MNFLRRNVASKNGDYCSFLCRMFLADWGQITVSKRAFTTTAVGYIIYAYGS